MFKDNEILARLDRIEQKIEALNKVAQAPADILDFLLKAVAETSTKAPAGAQHAAGKRARKGPAGDADDARPARATSDGEEWRAVIFNGTPTLCEVSTLGRVRRADTLDICAAYVDRWGTLKSHVCWGEKQSGRLVHTTAAVRNLVARAYMDETLPLKTKRVGLIDGNAVNCALDNVYIKAPKEGGKKA